MSRGNLKARRLSLRQVSSSRLPGPSSGIGPRKPSTEEATTMTTTTTRRAMLAIGATLPALAISSSWGAAPDPILAAIEAHRAACRVYLAAVEVSGDLADGTPEHDAASAVTDRAESTLDDAGIDLADVEPTTMAGLLALLHHVTELTEGDEFDGGNSRLPLYVSCDDGSEQHFVHRLLCSIASTLQNLTAAGPEKIGGRA